jgi:hypothetical protein
MATANIRQKLCYKCNKGAATVTCDGCQQSFCVKHISDHRQELSQQVDNIGQQHDILKRDIDEQTINETLLAQIDRWEKESIAKIRSSADEARTDLKRLIEESKSQLSGKMSKLSDELRRNREDHSFTEKDISQWRMQLEKLRQDLNTSFGIELIKKDDSSSLRLITIKRHDKTRDNKTDSSFQNAKEKPSETNISDKLSQNSHSSTHTPKLSTETNALSPSQSSSYPSLTFGLNQSSYQDVKGLFERLMLLEPMEKNGPMSGPCDLQTDQMEHFLSSTFGFKNIPGEYIVQGVKSFRLDRPPHSMHPDTVIHFPKSSTNSFMMTAKEIVDWQHSYKVYASKDFKGIDKTFLKHALQGLSKDGVEAFRMKYVVRISTCPVLMEFDGKIISRKLNDDWPNRIKLVSVTGIDFAGRKHDVGDILYYVSNWKDIFVVDPVRNEPALLNERDFCRRKGRPNGELHQNRLLDDLTNMARLRLRACDEEGVHIVVETGIGLGVFAGEHIGIATQVQIASALAIKTVLQQDGSSYKNIRAVVFALPIIDENDNSRRTGSPISAFIEQFHEPEYNGPIPVLIADQDMHRLTVAIAKHGLVVSQLNPADSHGVFGEYWQNRGPAVEEKLALTTLGLLVQHHLINQEIRNSNNYRFI